MFNYIKSLFILVAILLATVTVAGTVTATNTTSFQQAQQAAFRSRHAERIEALENRASALRQVYCFISNMNSHIPFDTMVKENTIGYTLKPTVVDALTVEAKLNSIEGLINTFNLEEAESVCSYLEDLFAQHLNAVRSAGYAAHWNWYNTAADYEARVYDTQIIICYHLINKMEKDYIHNSNIHLIN